MQAPYLSSLELNFFLLEPTFLMLLRRFMLRHPHITNLIVNAVEEWLESILLLPMSPSSILFSGGIPSSAALEHLPQSVRKVAFREREWSGRLWEFFDTLLALQQTGLQEVGAYLPDGFQWNKFAPSLNDTCTDDHALFFGKIMWYAQKLRRRGLEIVDEIGDTMDAAFLRT